LGKARSAIIVVAGQELFANKAGQEVLANKVSSLFRVYAGNTNPFH